MTRSTTIHLAPTAATAPIDLPDATLLDRFLALRDESAFGELVRRHGPGVLGTCRRRLGSGQDAEDACQATFLVLIRRADAIRRVNDVGAWLRGVARKVAARAKARADRDRIRKGASVDIDEVAGRSEDGRDDLHPALRAEVERLPEKYRRPVELCYWEGLSNDQAAERLDCPTGTVKWRLSRARELLRDRFVRRGIALTALLLWPRAGSGGATSRADASTPSPRPILGDGGGSVLSDGFILDTVALAVLVRDAPPWPVVGGSRGVGARRGRPRGRTPRRVHLIAILAMLSLSLSALAFGRRAPIEKRPAGSGLRVAVGRLPKRPAGLAAGAVSHNCLGEITGRVLIPTSSADGKGVTP